MGCTAECRPQGVDLKGQEKQALLLLTILQLPFKRKLVLAVRRGVRGRLELDRVWSVVWNDRLLVKLLRNRLQVDQCIIARLDGLMERLALNVRLAHRVPRPCLDNVRPLLQVLSC